MNPSIADVSKALVEIHRLLKKFEFDIEKYKWMLSRPYPQSQINLMYWNAELDDAVEKKERLEEEIKFINEKFEKLKEESINNLL